MVISYINPFISVLSERLRKRGEIYSFEALDSMQKIVIPKGEYKVEYSVADDIALYTLTIVEDGMLKELNGDSYDLINSLNETLSFVTMGVINGKLCFSYEYPVIYSSLESTIFTSLLVYDYCNEIMECFGNMLKIYFEEHFCDDK